MSSVACRRHRVLLWLGGLTAVPSGCVMLTLVFPSPGSDTYNDGLFALAGIFLLVGGVVRWGVALRGERAGRGGESR